MPRVITPSAHRNCSSPTLRSLTVLSPDDRRLGGMGGSVTCGPSNLCNYRTNGVSPRPCEQATMAGSYLGVQIVERLVAACHLPLHRALLQSNHIYLHPHHPRVTRSEMSDARSNMYVSPAARTVYCFCRASDLVCVSTTCIFNSYATHTPRHSAHQPSPRGVLARGPPRTSTELSVRTPAFPRPIRYSRIASNPCIPHKGTPTPLPRHSLAQFNPTVL